MDLKLKGKNAFVTGGERGIGRDICLSLAQEGVNIAYCDIVIEKGDGSTQENLRSKGTKVFAREVDVSDEDQVISMVQNTILELGGIDIFVSNAGIIEWEPVTKITLECWNRILGVNLTGAMLCTREVSRHMVKRKSGVILFFYHSIQSRIYEAAYRVSKTGTGICGGRHWFASYGIRSTRPAWTH
jgi:3-oxoacyl-[acyl-carrier protein] reductase